MEGGDDRPPFAPVVCKLAGVATGVSHSSRQVDFRAHYLPVSAISIELERERVAALPPPASPRQLTGPNSPRSVSMRRNSQAAALLVQSALALQFHRSPLGFRSLLGSHLF